MKKELYDGPWKCYSSDSRSYVNVFTGDPCYFIQHYAAAIIVIVNTHFINYEIPASHSM